MSETKPLFDWTPEMAAGHGSATFTGSHHLLDTGLFTDDALIEAFEAHNLEDMQIATMGTDPAAMNEWMLGTVEGVPGKDILAAIKTGRLWLNMLKLDNNPVYCEMMDQVFDDLDFEVVQRRVTMIVSSPRAQVMYHVDPEQVFLIHMRGHKTIYIFPADDWEIVDIAALERIFTGEAVEELPYDPAWANKAESRRLEPGQFVSWAHNGPHRVENGDDFNVSMSCSYYTPAAKRKERVFRANRYFRRFSPVGFRGLSTEGFGPSAKIAAFRAAQWLGIKPLERVGKTPRFIVDPNADFGRRLIDSG